MTKTTDPSDLFTLAAERGATCLARRRAREADREAEKAEAARREEVSRATLRQRFANVAGLVASAVHVHAEAAGLRLGDVEMAPDWLDVKSTSGGDRLTMRRVASEMIVSVRGRSRGLEWAPRPLDEREFLAEEIAAQVFAEWASLVEPAAEMILTEEEVRA